ncbi:solute carrier organic anion transporter family member 4A1-like [Salvelinus sp. IW2-2015]|uniref:solute carrier organic anion transporter family member 4A1-like n=1 Tax=Salvelinus sp. IW2-2015 TaxID=2691554 RepID=UPI0038D47715
MPILLNADASFSSKQELLDLQDSPMGPSLETPSPVDSQEDSPVGLGPGSAAGNAPAETPLPGQLYTGLAPAETPLGLTFIPADSEGLCGWGALTPRVIQTFNTPRWVLFFLCVASFLQGMIINGFINTVVTSIERRFDLRSYQTGLIASSYDIAACVCLAFVSYFGGTGHKPCWLGWGVLVMALGSLVFALPHFTTPPYQVSMTERTGVCTGNRTSPCHEREGGGLSSYRFVFMLGQFLHGVGATPLYTLGVTYLDENVKSSYAPVYIGIFYTAAIMGPAAGYLLGGYFLNIYTEIHMMTELTPENPLWVGAWWIGFLAGGAAALVVAVPILGYPRQLPGSQKYVSMRVSEAHQLKDGSQASASDPQFGKSVKDMPRSVLLLLKNPPFLFLCLAGATEATLIAGMSTFGPKFLESQFSLSASEAATWFGYMVVPAGGGGTFLGGYIVKKLNLRCRGIIRFCMVCAIISLLAIFIFLIHCPNIPMAGVTSPYRSNLPPGHQYNEQYYEPVRNSVTRLQLCGGERQHRGQEGLALDGEVHQLLVVHASLPHFLSSSSFFTFLLVSPPSTATFRCVPDSQRSFGLGIQWIVVRSLGGIPGPIAFGSVIDISCLLWQDQCGEQGSCYLYQNSAMSRYTLIAGIIYKVLGTMFFLLASVLYKPPPESPQSSCESTDHGAGNSGGETGDLSIKDLPPKIISNVHARL